jgi:phosphate-selective porin OprO/OprP
MMGGETSGMSLSGETLRSRAGGPAPGGPGGDDFPLRGRYRYNGNGTGPLGGGGYVHFGNEDDEFVVYLTNQITIDGTFFDRQNMPTIAQGYAFTGRG